MAHVSAERLAALATDPTAQPEPDEADHLAGCRACREDVDELGALAREVREVGATTLRQPHPDVWAGVAQQVALGPAGQQPRPLRRWRAVAIAAMVGLVVGVGGTLGALALRPEDRGALVASADLAALPGETGQGTAELVRERDTLQLRVHAALQPSPGHDYHEVWLINADGARMYALGVLPSSGDASYWLPPPLDEQLDDYSIVDISLEPDDGDTAHSRHSLVQGRLPG